MGDFAVRFGYVTSNDLNSIINMKGDDIDGGGDGDDIERVQENNEK